MSELELRAPKAAAAICKVLNEKNVDYAIGGALALAYWCEPRATIDVDITVYLPVDQPSQTVELLVELGCDFSHLKVTEQLREHGYCRATFRNTVVDFFLPTLSLYELAKDRRRQVLMEGVPVFVWEAEVLCIFKMMFMRTQDFADIEKLWEAQSETLDTTWIREQLVELFGQRDPRISNWDEIVLRTRG